MDSNRLFLLDAYALIFRAYYALIKVPRITRSGFNTSAIFGFVNTLEELIRRERPTHLAVCFDPAGPTFRSEAFEAYKGERPSTPEDIRLSVPIIKEILRAYRIPILEAEGFEADDVIGTMAKRAEREGFTTYMMTPDKDFGQLVSPSILQYKPSYRGQDFEIRGEEEVCAKYGITNTLQVIDLLALMGDKADNIPGCPKVGEKTAVALIGQFGSVENLLENTDQLKGALKKNVEENAEQIRFSKFLATIRTDVPLSEIPGELVMKSPDRKKLFELFNSLEFRQLAMRVAQRLDKESGAETTESLPVGEKSKPYVSGQPSLFDDADFEESAESPADSNHNHQQQAPRPRVDFPIDESKFLRVESQEDIDSLTRALEGVERCGLALASVGENDMDARWLGGAVALPDGRAWFISADYDLAMGALLDLMARHDIEKVTLEAKRDFVLASRRRTDREPSLVSYLDVTLCHYLLQPDMRHSLRDLAAEYLGIEIDFDRVVELPAGKKSATQTPDMTLASRRASIAALLALRLYPLLLEELKSEKLSDLLFNIELPLVPVLAEMELNGVRLDVDALRGAAVEMEKNLGEIQQEIYDLAGCEFNVGSPSQVGEILFDKLALDPKAKKTKRGQYSTSEDILEKLVPSHPIVGKILQFRQVKKLLSTYLMVLPELINPATGHIHTNYNQAVTATGRISSSSPNLQNIPVRDELGRDIRKAFIADPGNLFLSADYSQIELRLVADMADEEVMIHAFSNDIDIHAATAAKIHHKSPQEVSGDERRQAKTANFGILYGISAFGLASRLNIPRGEAKELIDNYFTTFPAIRKYISDSVERARETGYAITSMGRKRRLPDINSRNPVVRGLAERNAINAPIQGSAADIMKLAMIRIFNEMKARKMQSKMIMQVHDELNFDVLPEELPELQELVVKEMEGAWSGKVRLEASVGVAENWLDAH